MYCPMLDAEISAEDCGRIQDNDCADCENFEPFIWFLINHNINREEGITE